MSIDYNKLSTNQLTVSQRFRHSDLITDFVSVISSQSEGLGKMGLGRVKYDYDRSSQLIGIIWFTVSLFCSQFVCDHFVAISYRGPGLLTLHLVL